MAMVHGSVGRPILKKSRNCLRYQILTSIFEILTSIFAGPEFHFKIVIIGRNNANIRKLNTDVNIAIIDVNIQIYKYEVQYQKY